MTSNEIVKLILEKNAIISLFTAHKAATLSLLSSAHDKSHEYLIALSLILVTLFLDLYEVFLSFNGY